MTGQGFIYEPGQRVDVETVDPNNNGTPSEGDLVEISGETDEMTQVELVASLGNEGIGVVMDTPSDENGNETLGDATLIVGKPVVALTESSAGALSAGDEVQEDAGGTIVGYDGAGTQTSTPLGQVFAADGGKYGFPAVGDVAVALYR